MHKYAAPLIRRRSATPSPQGEGYIIGDNENFQRLAAIRYETGDARPGGEGYIKGSY